MEVRKPISLINQGYRARDVHWETGVWKETDLQVTHSILCERKVSTTGPFLMVGDAQRGESRYRSFSWTTVDECSSPYWACSYLIPLLIEIF